MDYSGRQDLLRRTLSEARLDGMLVTHLPNIRYLCGFTGSAAALLVTAERSIFFTDGRYTAQARAEVEGPRLVIGRKAPLVNLMAWLDRSPSRGPRRLGFESEHISFAGHRVLVEGFPRGVRLRPTSGLIERLRMIKEPEELEKMRSAAQLGAKLFERARTTIRPGVTELEVAAELEHAAARAGAEGMSFPTIIASGARSALPHGRASGQPIPPGGFVVCDFGVILSGYCSDMTRTVHVGPPSEEARSAYSAVLEAQQAAVCAVRAGRETGEVDRAARKILIKHKLGKYFTHSTGHGVGLEIHEAPRVAAGQPQELSSGMVITIEPGVYLPGKWGIRIEDMVVVTDRGCEVLTSTSKELIAC